MPYSSLQDFKNWTGISGQTWDAFITSALTQTSQLADRWTGRNFSDVTLGNAFASTHSVTETFFLNDGDTGLLLREWPVTSITSITDDGVTVDADRYELDSTFGEVTFIDDQNLEDLRFGRLECTFVAGFSSVPAPILTFVRRGTSYLLSKRLKEGFSSELSMDHQLTFSSRGLEDIFKESGAASYTLDHIT